MTSSELHAWYRLFTREEAQRGRTDPLRYALGIAPAIDFKTFLLDKLDTGAIVIHSNTFKRLVDQDRLSWREVTTGIVVPALVAEFHRPGEVLPYLDGKRVYVNDLVPDSNVLEGESMEPLDHAINHAITEINRIEELHASEEIEEIELRKLLRDLLSSVIDIAVERAVHIASTSS